MREKQNADHVQISFVFEPCTASSEVTEKSINSLSVDHPTAILIPFKRKIAISFRERVIQELLKSRVMIED